MPAAIRISPSAISATRCARSQSTSASTSASASCARSGGGRQDNSVIEGAYYAIGEIDYQTAPGGDRNSENGYILYIKPGYHGTESAGRRRLCDRQRGIPAREHGRPVLQRVPVRELSHAGLRDHGQRAETGAGTDRSETARHSRLPPSVRSSRRLARPADDEKPPRLSDALKFLDKEDLAAARKILAP